MICPQDKCDAPLLIELDTLNKERVVDKSWDMFSKANNCKIVIKAEPTLNAKIILEVIEIESSKVDIFFQPNNFNPNYKSHGLLENNMF